jgi:hypothetical protein
MGARPTGRPRRTDSGARIAAAASGSANTGSAGTSIAASSERKSAA